MRYFFLFLLCSLSVIACSDNDKLPGGVLPPQKMEEVMWDMIRAGEFLHSFVLYRDSNVNKAGESQKWYNRIYQLHAVSKEDFDKSLTYYREHPVLLKTILDTLAKRQVDSRPAAVTGQKPAQDSATGKTDTIRVQDTLKRRFDTLLRKRIIKKGAIKPV